MKPSQLLISASLSAPAAAVPGLQSFTSASSSAAAVGLNAAKGAAAVGLNAAKGAAAVVDVPRVAASIHSTTNQAASWIAANPGTAVGCGVAGVGVVMIATPGLVAAPVLGAAGFGAKGIVAGSTAAAIQSGMGSVVAPGLFATLQSAAAGGYGAAAVAGGVQAAGALVSSAGAALAWNKAK